MKLAMYGIREWGGAGLAALAIIILLVAAALWFKLAFLHILAALVFGLWLCVAAFFRSPHREVPADASLVTAPADGVVYDIEEFDGVPEIPEFNGVRTVRVGIFLSVFNVHLNRAPCDMRVSFRKYKEGKFHDARSGSASKENESMTIAGEGKAGDMSFPVAVRQISGAIARRIVCEAEPGLTLKKGDTYGMIKFGSRTELYLPANDKIKVLVKVGDKTSAGVSVMAKVD